MTMEELIRLSDPICGSEDPVYFGKSNQANFMNLESVNYDKPCAPLARLDLGT